MNVVDFTVAHIEQATRIARQNYEREREAVPALPSIESVPDLTPFARNGLGVAAVEDGRVLGFLCGVPPFKNAFGSTRATGVFSPMGANAAVGEDRAEVYARMYQAAGAKWAGAGAASHAVCLYAHDAEAQAQFFRYGFGLRCVDAIRGMDGIIATVCAGYTFAELLAEQALDVLPLVHLQDGHMSASPTFILRPSDTPESFAEESRRRHSIYFAAQYDGRTVAYIRAERGGETFIMDTPGYLHVQGAYCLPEHRGRGLHRQLLCLLINKLRAQGCTRLGVDFESINPAAYGFWPKYFAAYTHSVVRRIDEGVI